MMKGQSQNRAGGDVARASLLEDLRVLTQLETLIDRLDAHERAVPEKYLRLFARPERAGPGHASRV